MHLREPEVHKQICQPAQNHVRAPSFSASAALEAEALLLSVRSLERGTRRVPKGMALGVSPKHVLTHKFRACFQQRQGLQRHARHWAEVLHLSVAAACQRQTQRQENFEAAKASKRPVANS